MTRTQVYFLRRINFPNNDIIIRDPNQSFTCGRGKDNQFICPSMLVSRQHCIFIVHSDGLYIRDLKSSNGVFVNGEKKLSDIKLNPGDIIGIGSPNQNPTTADCFVYSLEMRNSDEELLRIHEDANVTNMIKVEKDDNIDPENGKRGHVIKQPDELDDTMPPKKLMKLKANESGSNSIGLTLERTTVADPVSNFKSPTVLGRSTRSAPNPVTNAELVTGPIPSTSFASIPPTDLVPIKPDPDNDDIQILGYYSFKGKKCSEENSKTNKPETQSAKVLSKAREKSTKSGEYQLKNTPYNLKITNIQSIQPNISLDESLQKIRDNNLTTKNSSKTSQAEITCGKSCDPKISLNHNFQKVPESIQSDSKLGSKPPNTLDNLSGRIIKKANKENFQFLSNGHMYSSDNIKVNSGNIRIQELNSLKNTNAKTNGGLESKQNGSDPHVKTEQPAETNYDSDDELFVVAEVDNGERKAIQDKPNTGLPKDLCNNKASTYSPIKLKAVKKEPTEMSAYSEVDIVCLSSDDEDELVFPCSQLFDSVEMESGLKQEQIEEFENEVSKTREEEDDVIFLSDSEDEEYNPWFHRLYNSQVYKPSQDFCVKNEVQEEDKQTNGFDEVRQVEEKNVTWWKDHLLETEEVQDDEVWDENIQSQESAAEEEKLFEKRTSSKVAKEAKKSILKSIVEKPIESKKITRPESEQEIGQPPKKKIRKVDVSFTEKKEHLVSNDLSSKEENVSLKSADLNSDLLKKIQSYERKDKNEERRKSGLEETVKDSEKLRDSKKLDEREKERRRNDKDVREMKKLNDRRSRSGSVNRKETRQERRSSDETRQVQKVYVDKRKRQSSSIDRQRRPSSSNDRDGRRYSDETREKKKKYKSNEEFVQSKKEYIERNRKTRTVQVDGQERNKENQLKQEKENQIRKELEKNQRGKDLDQKKSSEFERKRSSEFKTSEDASSRMNISNGDLQNTETPHENFKRPFELPKTKNIEVEMQKLEKTFGNATLPPNYVIPKRTDPKASISTNTSKTDQQNLKTLENVPLSSTKPSEVAPKKSRCFEQDLQSIDEALRKPPIHPRKTQLIEPIHMLQKKRRGQGSSTLANNDYPEGQRKILPSVKTHQKHRRSKSNQRQPLCIPRDEKERIVVERKEKLRQVELEKKLNAEPISVPIVDRNPAPAKAKVTHQSRQDYLINEHLKTASLKPGIAHQRMSNAKQIAHSSKTTPEVENIQRDNARSSTMKETSKKKDESHHQEELRNSHVEEEQAKENNKNFTDFYSSSVHLDEKDDIKAQISLSTHIKKKKKVVFREDLNTTQIFLIPDNNSLQRVVGKDAPINRKKPPCQSMVKEYLIRIFSWNPSWLEEQKDRTEGPPVVKGEIVRPMKNRYHSFEDYCNFLRPLLLLETWNVLSKETECEEKKYKFRSIVCSVVRNSVKNIENMSQTSFLLEFLISKEDFKKDQYPGIGHLIIFEYESIEEDSKGHGKRKIYHRVFGYVTNKKHTTLWQGIHYNKELNKFVPNPEMLVTLTVLTRNNLQISTDRICRMRGAMYLKSNMREIQALQHLQSSKLKPLILNPVTDNYQLPEMSTRDSLATKDALNEKQIEAVMRISEATLSDKPNISLIHGPPGTGKSKVIVNIVAQILLKGPDTKILVCAPSNAAIDEIVIRLLAVRQTLQLKNLKMVRVGRLETMNHNVKNVSLSELGRKQVEKEHKVPERQERIENENNIKKYESIINEIEEKMKVFRDQKSFDDLRQKRQDFFKRCQELKNMNNPVDLKKLNPSELHTEYRRSEELILSKATVIACTLSSCYSGLMEKLFGQRGHQQIQICIVDEATQSCETENLIPLMLGVEKMILVGDTNQLPATILSKTAKENGLDQSLFSRLQKTFAGQTDNPIIMLDTQYRMDHPISSWPNLYFYQGKLKDKAVVKDVPYCSYRVLNLNSTQDESKFSNAYEADFVAKIIYIMVTSAEFSKSEKPVQIGVITPYQSQRNVIDSRIERRLDSVSAEKKKKVSIEVNTVDSFQGQERDVIIMSCVRTNGIGFMSDKQRLCVALTRAKSSLILCGNFKTFEKDEMWSELLNNAKMRDVYIDVEANISLGGIQRHISRH